MSNVTDEQIASVYHDTIQTSGFDVYRFARAILALDAPFQTTTPSQATMFTEQEVESIVKLRVAQFAQRKGPYAVTAPKGCHPEEWGPSDARRLTCACGNPDPAHWEVEAQRERATPKEGMDL
jgi:hypothetical protein